MTGNVTITSDSNGTVSIANGIITGNFTVNAKNATVNNAATINGTTTINDVSNNTFNNSGVLNVVIIKDFNGGSFNNTGVINKDIIIETGVDFTEALVLKGTIDATVKVTGNSKSRVNIEGKVKDIILQAKDAILTLAEKSEIVNPVIIDEAVTIISVKPVKSKIGKDVDVTVKESEKSVGKQVKGEGKDKEVKLEVSKSPYTFNTALDKEGYGVNDDITISGSLLEGEKALANVDISLKVTDFSGNIITVEQLVTDDQGKFQHTFKVPEETEVGKYTITIKAHNPVNESMEEKLVIKNK